MDTFPFWLDIPNTYSRTVRVFTGCLSCYRGPVLLIYVAKLSSYKKIHWDLVKFSGKPVLINHHVYFLNPLQWLASALGEPFILYIYLFMCFLRQKIIKQYTDLLTRNINKSFWISLKESCTFRLTKHKKGKLTC